jgi:hypothetical protein
MVDSDARGQLRQLTLAVGRLAASADEQRQALAGAVVADELALDYASAYDRLPTLSGQGVSLGDVAEGLARHLDGLLSVPPGAEFWSEAALVDDPAWEEVRTTARALQTYLPVE